MGQHTDRNDDGIADAAQAELPQDKFRRDDGTVYQRVDPDQFLLFDEVDSMTINDPGAPD